MDLPKTLVVGECELLLKSEFHISLICAKRIAPMIDAENADKIEAEMVEFFKQFIKEVPLREVQG